MSRKLALSLLFFFLGLVSVDSALDHKEWWQEAPVSQNDDMILSAMHDGTGAPPRP